MMNGLWNGTLRQSVKRLYSLDLGVSVSSPRDPFLDRRARVVIWKIDH